MMRLKAKAALVTGGGSGIGRATAKRMALEGARVAVCDRDANGCAETVAEIKKEDGEAIALVGDVSRPEDVQRQVNETAHRFGQLDIVVPNAGLNGVLAPIEDLTPEEWDIPFAVNTRGTFLTVKYAIPHLRKRGGSIVIVSSVNGTRLFSSWGFAAYSSSKAAQVAFARMAAVELARWNIRVNVVCPGASKTNIMKNTTYRNLERIRIPREYPEVRVPLHNRPAEPDEIAANIVHLASDDARYVTGAEVYVDGALSLFQG